jgi:inner membrane protein
MSSPVGHSLAGYIFYCLRVKSGSAKRDGILFSAALFTANLPDLDFLPGLIIGQPNLYHHGISHSIGAALVAALLMAWGVGFLRRSSFLKNYFFFFAIYCSHLLLDFFSIDTRPPAGIPALWPLTLRYFISSHPILPPVRHSHLDNATTFQVLTDIFSLHNLYAIFLECSIMLPVCVIIFLILKRKPCK